MKALFVAALIALVPAVALARPGLDAVIGPDGVTITDSERPVLFYRTKPAGPAEPGRLNYVHPLYAPDGTLLTEDRPADHLHQRGVFWSWHQVRLGGDLVADGWFMKGLTFFVKQTNFDGEAGGFSLSGLIASIDDAREDRPLASACRVFALERKGCSAG